MRTLAEAADVEPVLPAQVADAEQAAERAEAAAAEAEAGAVLGKVAAPQADALRGAARYARLRARVTARNAVRHRQAERLRQLDRLGSDALAHAAKLPELRGQTVSDLAQIESLQAAVRERIAQWNAGLGDLIGRGMALDPHPPTPGGAVPPSSAGVYASAQPPRLIVKQTTLVPVDIEDGHGDGLAAMIDNARRDTALADPSMRLVVGANGVVVPVGRDPFGHVDRRVKAGELRELSAAERTAYLAGEGVSHG